MTYDFSTMSDRARVASAKYVDMFALKKDVPEDIVPFSMADMEFKNAPEIVEAIKEYVDTYPLGYVYATQDYLDALKNWMKTRHDRDIETDWIHPIPGVVCGIDAAILSLTEPGDGIVYCSPVFGLFKMGIEGHGRRPLASSVLWDGENWQMDFEDIERKAADPRTTAMIVCNPHNPLARVWTEEELRRLGDICVKNDLVLISDEIHGDLTMPGYELCSFLNLSEELNERLIVTNAPSKTFNLAGAQCGNMIIPNAEIREKIATQLFLTGIFTVSCVGFTACEAAYTKCAGWLDECIAHVWDVYEAVKAFCAERLPEVKVHDLQATYLAWMDFRALCPDAEELMQKMIDANVFIDNGTDFGPEGAGFIRLNLACPKEIVIAALERICKVFGK